MPAPDLSQVVAIEQDTQLFVMAESTFATEVKPNATSQVLHLGIGDIMQERGFLEDRQRRLTLSQFNKIPGRYEVGQLSASVYLKPSGTVDVAPECGKLLKSLFGIETVTGGTKVEYKPSLLATALNSLTVWARIGHTIYRMMGLVVEEGTFPLKADNSDDALAQFQFKSKFAKMLMTGYDYVATAIGGGGSTSLVVNDSTKFDAGGYLIIDGNTNSGAGWLISSINYGTHTLTLSASIANVAQYGLVTPWYPAAYALGSPTHGVYGSATHGGVSIPILSGSVTFTHPVDIPFEEKNGQDYPTRAYRAEGRKVSVTAEIVDDANASRFFYKSKNQVLADVVFPWQDSAATAGKKHNITLKNVEFTVPKLSGNTRKVLTLSGTPGASGSFDDEIILTTN